MRGAQFQMKTQYVALWTFFLTFYNLCELAHFEIHVCYLQQKGLIVSQKSACSQVNTIE